MSQRKRQPKFRMKRNGTKKYLTQLQEGQIAWIKRAAKDIGVTQPEILQMALMALISKEWHAVKTAFERNKAKMQLEAIEKEQEKLKEQAESLKVALLNKGVEMATVRG